MILYISKFMERREKRRLGERGLLTYANYQDTPPVKRGANLEAASHAEIAVTVNALQH